MGSVNDQSAAASAGQSIPCPYCSGTDYVVTVNRPVTEWVGSITDDGIRVSDREQLGEEDQFHLEQRDALPLFLLPFYSLPGPVELTCIHCDFAMVGEDQDEVVSQLTARSKAVAT